MKLLLHSYTLPHRHEFRIARGSKKEQEVFIVELEHNGIHGFGESAEDTYYDASIKNMQNAMESARGIIEAHSPENPEELWTAVQSKLADHPFALNALDIAAHDLNGKIKGLPLYKLWGLDPSKNVPTDYTIGIDTIEKMVEKMNEFPNWPIYKIKLGTNEDVAIVRELRQHTDSIFRLDANCGWTAEECISNARAFKELNVEFIEQPLRADDWNGMALVKKDCCLPVIADESCITEADVKRCAPYFDGINIKLCKCGGPTAARRMIQEGRELGLKLMIGCMTESSVGISAIAHLLPYLDYVDMDGALLLAQDTATGVTIDNGVVHYADVPGTGAQLLEPRLLS